MFRKGNKAYEEVETCKSTITYVDSYPFEGIRISSISYMPTKMY